MLELQCWWPCASAETEKTAERSIMENSAVICLTSETPASAPTPVGSHLGGRTAAHRS